MSSSSEQGVLTRGFGRTPCYLRAARWVRARLKLMRLRRDADFSPTEIRRLAEKASFRCSWPLCQTILIGPGAEDEDPSVTLGEAGHISSASKGGPRYDENMDPTIRKSALQNGIWLCPTHATLIDKNDGSGYSREKLWSWRRQREQWARGQLTGDDANLIESPFIVEFDPSDRHCVQKQFTQQDLQIRLRVTNVTEVPLRNVTCRLVARHPFGTSHFVRVRHDNEPPYGQSNQGIRLAPGCSDYFDTSFTMSVGTLKWSLNMRMIIFATANRG